jgi:hypothetical protein
MKARIVRALVVAAVALGILAAGTAPVKGPGTLSVTTYVSK